MQNAYFLIDENQCLRYLNGKALSYIDRRRTPPVGYPQGTLHRDDIVFYFSAFRHTCTWTETTLSHLGLSEKPQADFYFFLTAFDSPHVQAICKECDVTALLRTSDAAVANGKDLATPPPRRSQPFISATAPSPGTVLLNTIFQGSHLQVTCEPLKSTDARSPFRLAVTRDGQTITTVVDEAQPEQLLIWDSGGLRFFCDNRLADLKISLSAILQGTTWPDYCTELYSWAGTGQGIPLASILTPATGQALELAMKQPGRPQMISDSESPAALIAEPILDPGFHSRISRLVKVSICNAADLRSSMEQSMELYQQIKALPTQRDVMQAMSSNFRLWGEDEPIRTITHQLQKAASKNVTILLEGESGTGKTFLAREIHKNSRRAENSFVHVNCAAIPYHLIESELFGYEPGAFTGARACGKKGYFEAADKGTLFLDEITELPLSLQGKLLEVLQSKTFYRVGGIRKITVDIRLLVATNRNLKELTAQGKFRQDLYYRIHVFSVSLPPLRQRKAALHTIISAVLPDICARMELEPRLLSSGALSKLQAYGWPGNIRELENVLEKAAILSDGDLIQPKDILLPEENVVSMETGTVNTLQAQKEQFECQVILKTLKDFGGNRDLAAAALGISRSGLFQKMKKYNLYERERNS